MSRQDALFFCSLFLLVTLGFMAIEYMAVMK